MATVISAIPDHIAKAIHRIGANFDPDIRAEILALYDEIHSARPASRARVVRDRKYGPGDRHALDVHIPSEGQGQGPFPVIVFFHGGGFIEGHKNIGAGNIFGNIGETFAARGFVTVNATYQLAPEAPWPEGATQIGLAANWVQANIAEFGGDPDRVFLMGHSAGGTHVASLVYHDGQRDDALNCAGVVLVSATTDVGDIAPRPNVVAYYGDDAYHYARMATVRNIAAVSTPVMVINAEFDPPFFIEQAAAFVGALRRATDTEPVVAFILGHNHVSEIYHIGTDDDSIASQIVDFCLSV